MVDVALRVDGAVEPPRVTGDIRVPGKIEEVTKAGIPVFDGRVAPS